MTRQHVLAEYRGQPAVVPGWVVATAVAGTVLIALGAFWLSFTALTDLAQRAGIAASQAWVWPLIVDGIIVVATISVVVLAPYGRRATWYPWALLIAGAVVSVSGNPAHALVAAENTLPGLWAAAISAVPPLVLLAITHLTVVLTSRTARQLEDTGTAQDPRLPMAEPSREERRAVAWSQREAGWINKEIADYFGVHPSTVGRWFADPPPDGDGDDRHDDRELAATGAAGGGIQGAA
ncbi:DUF2637 domain-containing protein [Tessaracoccus sp. MC1679]|uniref:DUF2637 domain-containing protein n=1 Tax=Tessaracoccus sp. MC1679 TaxID=2760313 RepID=UPI001601A62B|nr:DUF2637 domain-containing protein [Tessaracoccus sp. MC1679]MBB1515871.1 DUF2637 domain-containing protein [Tessaracoccus sp. MC1679]